jgi:hypothetical protein
MSKPFVFRAMAILKAQGMGPKAEFGGWYGNSTIIGVAIGRDTLIEANYPLSETAELGRRPRESVPFALVTPIVL